MKRENPIYMILSRMDNLVAPIFFDEYFFAPIWLESGVEESICCLLDSSLGKIC